MSHPNPAAPKRRRLDAKSFGLADAERAILNLIKSKENSGIWIRDIKQETNLPDNIVKKAMTSLMSNQLIKEVPNIQNKAKKYYMAAEFEPSKELTGGEWCANGEIDTVFVDALKKVCFRHLSEQTVATLDGVHNAVVKSGVLTVPISTKQVGEILNLLVLDNEIIESKSTGLREYYSIPRDTTCYRVAGSARGGKIVIGGYALTPCGACPRLFLCASDGKVSPSTCVYYNKWSNMDF